MHKIVAVIPAYNEADRVTHPIKEALRYCAAVVVTDDGSRDATSARAHAAGAYVLRHIMNRGQGAALQTATDFALAQLSADIIVHFDADGQMSADDIPSMIEPIVAGTADIVLGSRFLGKEVQNMPLSRKITHFFARAFTTLLSGLRLTDTHNGFRALSKDAARKLRISLDGGAHASEILDLIPTRRLRMVERPVTILYTQDSLARGQSGRRGYAFGVVKDLIKKRLIG